MRRTWAFVVDIKRLIYTVPIVIACLIYLRGEPDRLVRYLEAQGYADVRLEHPTQHRCSARWSAYSYRARSPGGTQVHGGACVLYFIFEINEPIG
jgi:hypothetical protein